MPAVVSRSRSRRTKSEINMVPFIDVMLVLLIIFMVTAPLIAPSQIELPTVGQAARQPDRFVQVIIDAEGLLQVKEGAASGAGVQVTARELVARVRELQGPPAEGQTAVPVIITADRNVKYDEVIKTMDALQRAGIQRVGLSVQQAR
ncbi:biopolymer transporter ExbD [Tepidicella baoligensis]|uniref:biopolymer transporter ExbD n=1 Tax=Tepidicella baoligensis TaxID=2707016 RepID=UPI0015DBAE5F|nr:biopolymer transporter ExbD [Tepidicella baoligensis]